jgi:hypothetical protein
MKDLVTVLFVLLLGGGGAAGFFYWKHQKALAEAQAYEQIIDEAVERGIESTQLTPLLTTVGEYHGDKVELLRVLYSDPIKSDRINLTYGNLQGDWPTTYRHIAELNNRPIERGRFQAEIDDRFGPGAYVLMQAQYETFLADNSLRDEDHQRQENIWIFREYLRRNGRYPLGPIRIENRQVVEAGPSNAAQ